MQRRRLGRTGLEVSEIGLGALEIGRDWGIRIEGDFGRPGEEAAIELVRAALNMGVNFFDTAPAYQLSEKRLGKALQGRRSDVYIATKVGEHYDDKRGFWYDLSPDAMRASIEQSLRRLQTDFIDLLQIHSASIEVIERGEALAVMQEYQRSGQVRFVGMTGDVDAGVAAIKNGGYDTVQVPYNILDRRAEQEIFPLARQHDIGVLPMLPLAQGALTNKWRHLAPTSRQYREVQELQFLERPGQTLSQAAIRFILAHEVISSIIAGTRRIDNLRSNVAAAEDRLTPEELRRIEDVTSGQRV